MGAFETIGIAKKLGFDKCGIVPVDMMSEYEEKLEERMAFFPEAKDRYEVFRRFAHLKNDYPWAKAVVICSFWYGRYSILDDVQGRIAKYYLTDARRNTDSQGYQISIAFEKYLKECGYQTATDRDFGVTALRWAAMQAGIGIVRKNNFFYTERGSYQYLEAFLIDAPLKHLVESQLRPCAENCDLCIKACPTGSLEAPYMTCINTCVSNLTTWNGWDLRTEPLRYKFGKWIYGCEACQEACPYNKNAWTEEEDFPGLEELSKNLTYEKIVLANYNWLESALQPKLWYIPKNKVWKYKINALNAMLNHYTPEYLSAIKAACLDECIEVQNMAKWVLNQIPVLSK